MIRIIQLPQLSLLVLFVHYPLMALNTHPDTNLMLTRLISANIMSYDEGRDFGLLPNLKKLLFLEKYFFLEKNILNQFMNPKHVSHLVWSIYSYQYSFEICPSWSIYGNYRSHYKSRFFLDGIKCNFFLILPIFF